MNDLDAILATAKEAAYAAGALARKKSTEPRQLISKGFRDLVTDIDYASQKLIKDKVQARFPTHGFIAEEKDDIKTAPSNIVWIIDPIDGTTNYSRQIPTYTVSIGVAIDNVVVVGVIYDPSRDELFSAVRNRGSFLNDMSIKTNAIANLSESLISHDWSRAPKNRMAVLGSLQKLTQEARTIRAFGSAALALAWIACGRIEAYFNYMLGPWDIAAGALIVHEAGGCTTGFDGAPFVVSDEPTWGVSSNKLIHADLLHHL